MLQESFAVTTKPKPEEQEILQFTVSLQVFGIIFTISQGKIIDRFGTLAGNIFLCVFLVIGTIMTGESNKMAFVPLRVGRCLR